jgi:hypothetical protein
MAMVMVVKGRAMDLKDGVVVEVVDDGYAVVAVVRGSR